MTGEFVPELVRDALQLLGKRKLLLSIHDGSFPGFDDEDLGRGTPYSRGGRRFAAFVRALGFNALQLGPQGKTDRGNPSPYDGTAYSRNTLSIALGPLARDPEWQGLLAPEELEQELRRRSSGGRDRVRYSEAYEAQERLLERAFGRFEQLRARKEGKSPAQMARSLAAFTRRHRHWLEPDSLYEVLAGVHGSDDWRRWPERGLEGLDRSLYDPGPGERDRCRRRRTELKGRHGKRIERYAFWQMLAHRQHEALLAEIRPLGLELYADLQIGLSLRDVWALGSLFLPGYALGAPPSRTTPAGQPWGYPVFDPAGYFSGGARPSRDGPVMVVLRRRIEKLLGEYDGLRIDHPQGLVCPWVYRSDDPDALHAVQNGARLFASPNLCDHPDLAAYAIARADQLSQDPAARRYDDGWVRSLDQDQIERYAALMAVVVETAERLGRDRRNIACEVLSTLPYPLGRVIRLYDLGRFRVTQKADLRNPRDVYRSENAEPHDWIMLGTHDTPPIWRVAERWLEEGQARERADYLARRLAPDGAVDRYRAEFARDAGGLVHAQLADALASRAENVLIFFADLFGIRELYNTPGTVGRENWSLRVPADYERSYPSRASALQALNLPYALALALGSPARGSAPPPGGLIARLQSAAGRADR